MFDTDSTDAKHRRRVNSGIFSGIILGAALLYISIPNPTCEPTMYTNGYRGPYDTVIVKNGDNITNMINKRGYRGRLSFWQDEIEKCKKKKDSTFNVNRIHPGDTIYVPRNMKEIY